ncbi:MAG: ChaN family lipoprotein, partial [Betaproteobacteria bacterium]
MSSKYRFYLILLGTVLYSSLTLAETTASLCDEPGSWIANSPENSGTDTKNILEKAKVADFVLLGEQHDQASHHRWQAQMIASLIALRDDVVIGLEMLPRSAQNVLDQ